MKSKILVISSTITDMNNSTGYLIGIVLAAILLGYLVYSLVKPEKF